MDISRLQSMILVAERGSITAASKELFITPVSLLQQINQLENEVGFKIFLRSHRGVKLTKPGELFYKSTKKSLTQLEVLMTSCRNMEEDLKREIRIGIYWPFNLNPYIESYSALHPESRFFQLTEIYSDLSPDCSYLSYIFSKWTLDILQLDYEPQLMTSELAFLPFLHDRYHVAYTKNHPVAKQTSISLDDLCQYDLAFSLDISTPTPLQLKIESTGKTVSTEPCTNIDILKKVNAGYLYIMDGAYAKSMTALCAIPIEPEEPYIHGIVYKKNAPKHVLDFVDFVRQQVGEENIAAMNALLGR